jgi:hypothetical protein
VIVLLLVTKNEGEMLRHNIAHHLDWGFDHVAVADNRSEDETPDVLREFGDHVSSVSFKDFIERREIRMRMLDDLKDRFGRALEWAAVSDTDEFWWAPTAGVGELLASVPDDLVAVNFDQKLYLPTELDRTAGPVFVRRVHRTSGAASPLHTSYEQGKSFYRVSWLPAIDDEHWCRQVPHARWRHDEPALHHYMIQDEEQFVMKVRRLTAWQTARRRRVESIKNVGRRLARRPVPSPVSRDFKATWWSIYQEGGEEGLRSYYRSGYTLSADAVSAALEAGDLVHDPGFADHVAERFGVEGPGARPVAER